MYFYLIDSHEKSRHLFCNNRFTFVRGTIKIMHLVTNDSKICLITHWLYLFNSRFACIDIICTCIGLASIDHKRITRSQAFQHGGKTQETNNTADVRSLHLKYIIKHLQFESSISDNILIVL